MDESTNLHGVPAGPAPDIEARMRKAASRARGWLTTSAGYAVIRMGRYFALGARDVLYFAARDQSPSESAEVIEGATERLILEGVGV